MTTKQHLPRQHFLLNRNPYLETLKLKSVNILNSDVPSSGTYIPEGWLPGVVLLLSCSTVFVSPARADASTTTGHSTRQQAANCLSIVFTSAVLNHRQPMETGFIGLHFFFSSASHALTLACSCCSLCFSFLP